MSQQQQQTQHPPTPTYVPMFDEKMQEKQRSTGYEVKILTGDKIASKVGLIEKKDVVNKQPAEYPGDNKGPPVNVSKKTGSLESRNVAFNSTIEGDDLAEADKENVNPKKKTGMETPIQKPTKLPTAVWKVGDKGLKIAKGTPPWPVKIVGIVDIK